MNQFYISDRGTVSALEIAQERKTIQQHQKTLLQMQERNQELEEIMDLMELMGKAKDPSTKLQLCNAILDRIEAMIEEAKFVQDEITRNKDV
jgi:hypothetical protein